LEQLISASGAEREGRDLSGDESAAVQTVNAEWVRLGLLAGFGAPAEADAQEDNA
jgi:hypothetical protein